MQNYTLKTTKCHWEKLKASKNGETYHVHGSDDSISLRCQFSLNWSRAFWLLLGYFTFVCVEIDMWILMLPQKCKEPRMAKTILKNDKFGGPNLI